MKHNYIPQRKPKRAALVKTATTKQPTILQQRMGD